MNLRATMAQGLWGAGNWWAGRRFAAALRHPEEVQREWLRQRLAADAESAFGREHGFRRLRDYRDFAEAVPIRTWDDFAPWIERIRCGEQAVLSADPVTHLAPTSGSTGARKLIPFTQTLHRAFGDAVGAWMADLTRAEPAILLGRAYWSVSPLASEEESEAGAVRIGFADDAEYLGGWKARMVRWAMAVPPELRHERDMEVFWRRTAAHLLACRDLRLISVWHPSFLDLILQACERDWPGNPETWWPRLRVISCWGDQAAEAGMRALARRFPQCLVQAKGLLATEAVVTLPWSGRYPLAIGSHFFEFLTGGGEVRRAHELEPGQSYEVIVSNGGGLWRYRLGDLVECTGHCARTPTLRFLGRAGNVSDLCGEKLSEAFVAGVLAELWPDSKDRPEVAYLRPIHATDARGYELVVARPVEAGVVDRLEEALRQNPHYDLARRLGQLAPVGLCVDGEAGLGGTKGDKRRLGDVKPVVLQAARPE